MPEAAIQSFINLSDNEGMSALHFAGYKGRLRIAQALLAAGAQHDLQDDEGKTALNLAELYAHTSMKELLQEQVKHKRKFR
jgi:ankyrin repeat protein